jgi:acetyltransferase-like isoleucine patch superfamily enzyme
LPAPSVVIRTALRLFLLLRLIYYFVVRVFLCEPFLKAYCRRYGKHLHTGVFLPWISGDGEITIGDHVTICGKCTILFSARHSGSPALTIGSRSFIGHDCQFTIGRGITIGDDCKIAGAVHLFDMSGHPTEPAERLANLPTPDGKVRPIFIEDNVWIGTGAAICPGVTIGEGSVVAAYAVVTKSVRPNTLVAGNPAREMRTLATAEAREMFRAMSEENSHTQAEPTSVR